MEDANDTSRLRAQMKVALQMPHPVLLVVNSHIGYGSPNKQDSADVHGSPLGEEEVRLTKQNYGWNPDWQFYVPPEVKQFREENLEKGAQAEQQWKILFEKYQTAFPDLAREFLMIQNQELPNNWQENLPVFSADAKGLATRAASGKVLNAIAPAIPWLVGGSADLAPSTKTYMNGTKSFSAQNRSGRNLHFGIREHAMGAIVNGLVLSKLRAFGATFFVFSDYMKPSIRLAALMRLPTIYVFTHDSIGVGEDGPTHQPVEHLAALRATPNMDVFRPADANEVVWGWYFALTQKNRPTALILSRQNLPTLDRSKLTSAKESLKGGYVLVDAEGEPELILIGTGSEVHLCLQAYQQLQQEGIKVRVVSMPSTTLFERQSVTYREQVLPSSIKKRLIVEAGSSFGWERYVGLEGKIIALDTFGKSAPQKILMEYFGFTVENIIKQAKALLNK